MNVLIVDDNEMARLTLRQLTAQVPDLHVVAECPDALKAWAVIRNQSVDLLMLDIEMPEMSGIELVQKLGSKRPIIIFTTSKKEYAVDAFELNVADYLVKPITPGRFIQAIDKARELLESTDQQIGVTEDQFIFVRDGVTVRRLALADILYAEATGDYVRLYTEKQFYPVHATMKAVEQRLSAKGFLRVHRSYIIALDKVDFFRDGALSIREKAIPVADAYRSILNKRLDIL